MSTNNIHIGALNIRVPDMSRRDAQQLGEQVAKHLSNGIPETAIGKTIGELKVSMHNSGGASHDNLARMIAENIARRIR